MGNNISKLNFQKTYKELGNENSIYHNDLRELEKKYVQLQKYYLFQRNLFQKSEGLKKHFTHENN